jgi:hypothetical protein
MILLLKKRRPIERRQGEGVSNIEAAAYFVAAVAAVVFSLDDQLFEDKQQLLFEEQEELFELLLSCPRVLQTAQSGSVPS